MLGYVIAIPITILVLTLHHELSTRERAWPGGIFPAIYFIVFGYLLITKDLDINSSRDIFFYILGFGVFVGIWIDGRNSLKRKIKKELDKMKSYDMK
ncbi:hypothetical protein [Virgibacillus sp. SK37]|uniref:hypothetical protein n=1 Tax=Virgibacillus sp. SK37 TaxID=403957 RepID=UPI0004D0B3CA|nr:hypothetical protein [Virgibacillus sp. SK37]AIF45287.1 hypothetical protein X953_06550 [Virgibacillus sp. SK37]